jgi:hypothetical protein
MAKKIKGFFYTVYKSIEDAQLRKAQALVAEYKRSGYVTGGWQ